MIPYARHVIGEDDIAAVSKALRGEKITQGEKVQEFEHAFAKKVGAKYAIAVSSGTAALHTALEASVGPGGLVVTSPLTFIATSNTIEVSGNKPIFQDVDDRTLCLKPKEEKNVMVRAVLAVDYAGQTCNYKKIRKVFPNKIIIADAAHSLGAKNSGKLADITCFSFHAIKSITTGEGGMVVTDSPVYASRARELRDHGRDAHGNFSLGFNYRMTDFQAVLGLSQLKKLDRFIARRREIAGIYNSEFSRFKDRIGLPGQSLKDGAWHLYVIRVFAGLSVSSKCKRDKFRAKLTELGIGSQINYPLVTYWKPYNFYASPPIALKASQEVVSLPMWPMPSGTVDRVVEGVCRAIKEVL